MGFPSSKTVSVERLNCYSKNIFGCGNSQLFRKKNRIIDEKIR
jgi:hypothetical protein